MHVKRFVPLLASVLQIISVLYHCFWYLFICQELTQKHQPFRVLAWKAFQETLRTWILEEMSQLVKRSYCIKYQKIRDFHSEGIWEEDTPTTAGNDGVVGKTKSHTVMLNCTRIQGGDWDSSSISIFPKSPQLADSKGDWRTWCNPSQIDCRACVCSRSTISQSAP